MKCTRIWDSAKSRDSSVGIALGYDRGSRVRFQAGAGNFFLHHSVQNGSGSYPASYPMDTRNSFPGGVKLTTHLHLVPRSKNEWSYTSTPPVGLHGVMLSLNTGTTLPYGTQHKSLKPDNVVM
jgi:hypothetical protein